MPEQAMPVKTALALALVLAAVAAAGAAEEKDKVAEGLAEYRSMLAEGNPAELWEMEGESLWKSPRGPKNASLEQCDLGLGAGVVKGVYAHLPKYFKDTDKVQDLESRLMTCMETLQGIPAAEVVKAKWDSGERKTVENLVAYIVGQSRGVPLAVEPTQPKEQEMYALGEAAFYYRSGPYDFSCATCHGEDGKRIRLQELPNLNRGGQAGPSYGSWPAYRVSNSQFWTMQHRLEDCYRQQRFPQPIYGSDVTVALSLFMAANGKGTELATPGIKR